MIYPILTTIYGENSAPLLFFLSRFGTFFTAQAPHGSRKSARRALALAKYPERYLEEKDLGSPAGVN
jgi:hypothetical protein